MTGQLETCANCFRTIGRLETPFIWQGQIVCSACHTHLSQAAATPPPDVLPYARPALPAKAEPGQIICPNPNCGYRGPAFRSRKGSVLIMVGLLLLAFIPGLIYAILRDGYTVSCPRCGLKIRDE
ncbi:MAG: hypothetical protein ACM359_03675 [Bacillota bacterium]